jgi:hypothetical protein
VLAAAVCSAVGPAVFDGPLFAPGKTPVMAATATRLATMMAPAAVATSGCRRGREEAGGFDESGGKRDGVFMICFPCGLFKKRGGKLYSGETAPTKRIHFVTGCRS